MSLSYLALLCIASDYGFQLITDHDWTIAADRSFFQISTLFMVYLFYKPTGR